MSRALTPQDKVAAFKVATASFLRRIEAEGLEPMDDAALENALRDAMGVFSGRCGPSQLHVTWQGAGLKIWASWHIHNHVAEPPIFAGRLTTAMARDIYAISDPSIKQLCLF